MGVPLCKLDSCVSYASIIVVGGDLSRCAAPVIQGRHMYDTARFTNGPDGVAGWSSCVHTLLT